MTPESSAGGRPPGTVAAVSKPRLRSWSDHVPADSRGDFTLPEPGTLVGAWIARLSSDGRRPLLHNAGRWVDRKSFLEATSAIAGRLHQAGLVPGDRVLISGQASIDLVVAHVACLRLGLVVVPTNGAYREPELTHLVRDARPRAALVDHHGWADSLRSLDDELLVTTSSVDLPEGPPPPLDQLRPDSPALIAYTSGTTGRPKGAVHTQASLLAGAHSVAMAWRWTEVDRLLLCLPMFHMHGLGIGLHGTLLVGGSAVLQAGFDPDQVLAGLDEHDCTMFFGVPTMYHRLVEHPGVRSLGEQRLCVSGSAPLAPDLHRRLVAGAHADILERYGTTETLMLISNPYDGERRPGSVGTPLPGVEVYLDEMTGEVLARGPNVFAGYWNQPEATSEVFEDGWFRTGDLAEVTDNGYVSIIGRAKELIISGGLNVYPREVDDVLATHPAVADVAVAGVPSAEWGEDVVAWVVPSDGAECPTAAELRAFASSALASYKLPRRVVPIATLPRNALGKVLRHELRETENHG